MNSIELIRQKCCLHLTSNIHRKKARPKTAPSNRASKFVFKPERASFPSLVWGSWNDLDCNRGGNEMRNKTKLPPESLMNSRGVFSVVILDYEWSLFRAWRERKPRDKNGGAKSPPFFPRDLFTVTLDGLSERRTTFKVVFAFGSVSLCLALKRSIENSVLPTFNNLTAQLVNHLHLYLQINPVKIPFWGYSYQLLILLFACLFCNLCTLSQSYMTAMNSPTVKYSWYLYKGIYKCTVNLCIRNFVVDITGNLSMTTPSSLLRVVCETAE